MRKVLHKTFSLILQAALFKIFRTGCKMFLYKRELSEGEYIVCRVEAENFEDLVTVALDQASKYLFGIWLPHHNLTTEPFSAEKYYRGLEGMACMEIWVKPLPLKNKS